MTATRSADAVIVGGGVIGAAIAYHLALAGLERVVVCEQSRIASQGATARSGGLLRLHHTTACDTRLTALSLPTFEQWGEVIGGDCGYRRTGFAMLVGEEHVAALRVNTAVAAEALSYERVEVIDPDQAGTLFPGLDLAGVAAVAYEPSGGYADPAATATSLIAAARRIGVSEAEGTRVVRVLEREGAVTGVETSAGRIEAPLVVLTSGAWGAESAAHLGVEVPVVPRRIGLAQVALPGAGRRGSDNQLPTCIDDTIGSYFRPGGTDRFFFGVQSHPDVDLEQGAAPLTGDEVNAAVAAVSRRVPAVTSAPLVGTRAGYDGYTPDKRPVIGPAGPDGLYLALGFSGGGFKLAPAVAELAAREISEGEAVIGKAGEPLLEPYRPQRFANGNLITPEAPYAHI
ncbi:NAD(P)/FAD-dependent oxidoreductase [Streptomyces buecherae]|uniref:NAD(P)/FAD-dependent oxidoreductase n=1 Tax=Streptomyces buecherae TaxID=2763006 RepID=UPI001C26AFB7|nr:FAD-dependent oxidoreductase [Streptomyces buecherae]